jgi:hypothetical protein
MAEKRHGRLLEIKMNRNRSGFTYVFFYLLFSDDTWRILTGLFLAMTAGPVLGKESGLPVAGQAMVWVMLLCMGYAGSASLARGITGFFKKVITGRP